MGGVFSDGGCLRFFGFIGVLNAIMGLVMYVRVAGKINDPNNSNIETYDFKYKKKVGLAFILLGLSILAMDMIVCGILHHLKKREIRRRSYKYRASKSPAAPKEPTAPPASYSEVEENKKSNVH